jgi:hypothetical protein
MTSDEETCAFLKYRVNRIKNIRKKVKRMSEEEKVVGLTEKTARKWLLDRGVKTVEIAELVYFLQKDNHKDLNM